MNKEIIKNKVKEALEKDPLKKEINRISLFGSYQLGVPRDDSDIDLLVEFNPSARVGFFKYIDLQLNLEKSLGKKVDLLTPEAVSKFLKEKIFNQLEIIYER